MVSNAKMYINGETSDSNSTSYVTLPPCKRMKYDLHRNNNNGVLMVKFKGGAVCTTSLHPICNFASLQAQNGNWGAQIYAKNRRIWLGTYKSETEAAMAYDSAVIKIRGGDSHRNFPWAESNNQETNFQNQFTTEEVLNMIKDGTYQQKFSDFLRIQSQREDQNYSAGEKTSLSQIMAHGDEQFSCRKLFQKELTPSDVGKLNRLVIQKQYAVKYFPYINENLEENNALNGGVDDVELWVFDKQMRPWNFRYCFWRSSKSFVLTKGWNRFVKEKELKEKDTITFYHCECTNNAEEKEGQYFFLIDVIKHSESGLETQLQLEQNNNVSYNSKIELRDDHHEKKKKKENKVSNLDVHESKGFRLFGINIRK